MITREFNLYLHAGHSIPLVINVNQYDQGEQWLFTLFNADGTQYVPSSGAIVGIKSDNLGIINSGTVDSQGRVVINETQQMTASVGKAVFELVIDDGTHGTANFVVLVEEKPGNNADLSESDISMIEEAIEAASNIKPYGSPLVASTVAGMTDHEKVYVYVGSETGYTSGHWYYYDGDSWEDGGVYNSVAVQTDTTLTLSGVAADAKKTGDEISDLKSQISSSQGMSAEFKVALEDLVNQLVYKGDDPTGRTYINALHTAMYPPANLTSITAVYTQSGTVYDTDALDSLKTDLVVTARYDNGTTEILADSAYTLSGTLAEGTSAITVAYGGKTTTFNVTVSSLWLYKLASPFTSTDDIHLDTGVQLQTGKTYTFLVDFLLSATHSASGTRKVDFIYSNKVGEDTAYIGLQTITTYLWGMGVTYSSAKTVAANKRYRNVAVVTVNADGSCSIANKNKNVTDGTAAQSATNTYATGNAITSATYFLGKANEATTSKAFTGTVNDFAIYDGEMSASEINDYLANGAS